MAEFQGGVVGALPGGLGPEVEGVAAAAALEAVEGVLLQVGGEAAAGAGGGAVQGAGATLLGAVRGQGLEAEQVEDGGQGDGGADGGEVDGWPIGDNGLTLPAAVLGLALLLTPFASLDQLAIAFGEDLRVAAFEPGLGRDVAEGAVQPDRVVMRDELADDSPGLVERQRHLDADAIALDRLVPAFDLAVRLRVVGRGPRSVRGRAIGPPRGRPALAGRCGCARR